MSVFRRGLKLAKGALHDELGSSSSEEDDDDDVESQADDSEEDEDNEEQEGEEEDDDDDGDESDGEIDLGWKYEPGEPSKAARAPQDDDEESEEERIKLGDVLFPVTCEICEKLLFTQETVEAHMQSKLHKKNEQKFNKQQKMSSRTTEQVEKLKARNQRKKERRMQRKLQEKQSKPHVWGEHKFPLKNKKAGTPDKTQGKKNKQAGDNSSAHRGGETPGGMSKKRKAQADAEEVGLATAKLGKKVQRTEGQTHAMDGERRLSGQGTSNGVVKGNKGQEARSGERGEKDKKMPHDRKSNQNSAGKQHDVAKGSTNEGHNKKQSGTKTSAPTATSTGKNVSNGNGKKADKSAKLGGMKAK